MINKSPVKIVSSCPVSLKVITTDDENSVELSERAPSNLRSRLLPQEHLLVITIVLVNVEAADFADS